MSTPVTLGQTQVDALREIGNIGAGNAATSLSQMTGTTVQMGIPTVKLLPVEEIADEVGAADDIVAAMFLGIEGDVTGHMLFVMSEHSARNVVDLLMGGGTGDAVVGAFSEIELSALQEVSNIMTGAYLNALSQITGLRLEPTPPAVGVDFAGALLGAALAEVALVSETALLLETTLGDEDTPSVGDFLFIPTSEALATVLERLGVGG